MHQDVAFARDIRPLFSERDVSSMASRFDLSSYDDVRANAERIYERLADGTMPCYGPWPADDVQRFRAWIDNGCARWADSQCGKGGADATSGQLPGAVVISLVN
jgi:hypothetical protein